MENPRFASQGQRQAPRSPLQARRSPLKAPRSPLTNVIATPFSITCPLVRDVHSGVFVAAEIGDDPGHLHWGGGAQRDVAVIFGMDQIGQLPEALAELVLPLLQTQGVVKFSVKPWSMTSSMSRLCSQPTAAGGAAGAGAAAPRAVSMVEVSVQPLEGSRSVGHATMARKLLAESRSATWRMRRTSVRPRLTVELVCVILGRLSAQEIFGEARHVNKTWRDAANRVAPPTSYRRQVAESMFQKPARPSAYASQSASASQSSAATQSPAVSQSPAAGTAAATVERLLLPSVEWLSTNKFEKCEGEYVMARLEDAVRWLDEQALEEEMDPNVHERGALRQQWDGLNSQLPVIRQLCVEKGFLQAAAAAAQGPSGGETSPAEASATRAFGVRTSSAGAAAAAAAVAAAAQEAEDRRRATGEHRWDGWRVFALQVALAFSEDRQFLCRWTMEALGETGGLPRSQMIEVLCRMHQALLPPVRVDSTGPAAFQNAADVSSVWDAAGSYQLRADLRACIQAMEGCFLRLPGPAATTTRSDQGCSQSQCSRSRGRRIRKRVEREILTSEQLMMVNTKLIAGERLKVLAFAGTGKTTCLQAWAEQNPGQNILYITFNKSTAVEAGLKFPENVTCNTINSVSLKGDLCDYERGSDGHLICTVKHLQEAITQKGCAIGRPEAQRANAKDVMETLMAFLRSKDDCLQERHFRFTKRTAPSGKEVPAVDRQWVLRTAGAAWGWMENKDGLPMSYAGILKVFQRRQKTDLELGAIYDVIMLDEAQDINDCTADIVLGQTKCAVIIVGDPHQTIYGWNGARDHITKAQATKTLHLTQVFRFGLAIASVANAIVSIRKGEKRPLLGSLALSNSRQARVIVGVDRQLWLSQTAEAKGDYTFLARTNAGLIEEALDAIARGVRVTFLNGAGSVKFWEVSDLCNLMLGKTLRAGASPELKACGTIGRLRELLESSEESDVTTFGPKLQLIDDLMEKGRTPQDIINDIQNLDSELKRGGMGSPLITLSTVHRAKGLEFDTVVLARDLQLPLGEGQEVTRGQDSKANLVYVAVTRAKRVLVPSTDLAHQLSSLGMWDSLSVKGSDLDAALELPAPCCGYFCQNDCPAGAEDVAGSTDASLRKRLVFGGSMSQGALCELCVKGDGGERAPMFPYASELFPRLTPGTV